MSDQKTIIRASASSSFGGSVDSCSISANMGSFAQGTIAKHPLKEGILAAAASDIFSEAKAEQDKVLTPRKAPDANIMMDADGTKMTMLGYTISPNYGTGWGVEQRSVSIVHQAGEMDAINLSIYQPIQGSRWKESLEIGGSLPTRMAKIVEQIMQQGSLAFDDASDQYMGSLKAVDTNNRWFIATAQKMLNDSSASAGYKSLADLDAESPLSLYVNDFIYNALCDSRQTFFTAISTLAASWGLTYAPGIVATDYGRLVNPKWQLDNNATDAEVDGRSIAIGTPSRMIVPPAGLLIEAAPVAALGTLLMEKGIVGLRDYGALVYPTNASGVLTTVPIPGFLPSSVDVMAQVVGSKTGLNGVDPLSADFDSKLQSIAERTGELVGMAKDLLTEYAATIFFDRVYGPFTATVTSPLDLDPKWRVGDAFTVSIGDGRFKGLLRGVSHTLDSNKGAPAPATTLSFSHVQVL